MNPDRVESAVYSTFQSLHGAFQPHELAYLALTCKVELPIRDRWAFLLHQKLAPLSVAREWWHTDIAVLDALDLPVALIELTAMYSFDALIPTNLELFIEKLAKDGEKAHRTAAAHGRNPGAQSAAPPVYTVLLATHPCGEPQSTKAVKYRAGITRALIAKGDGVAVRGESIKAIESQFAPGSVLLHEAFDGGWAFGVQVEVLGWVLKA
jgi:hypothetical protein